MNIKRYSIFEVLEKTNKNKKSIIYDSVMFFCIALSILPLTFKSPYYLFSYTDRITVSIFILDYILRWLTADFKLNKGRVWSFIYYPFSTMAIIDMLSILPGLSLLNNSFKALRISRILRMLRLLRFIKYFSHIVVLIDIMKQERRVLLAVLAIAIGYIFTTALIMFNAEIEYFNSFFDALYWASSTLATVGYGDITPHTYIGKFISMVSSLFGIAIIALPSGIITVSYMERIRCEKNGEGEGGKEC